MYAGWRGRNLAPLISTVFVATVGILSGKAENLSGNQSIHLETAIDRKGIISNKHLWTFPSLLNWSQIFYRSCDGLAHYPPDRDR
jgi:hypothetical protein